MVAQYVGSCDENLLRCLLAPGSLSNNSDYVEPFAAQLEDPRKAVRSCRHAITLSTHLGLASRSLHTM